MKREDLSSFYERINYTTQEQVSAERSHINLFERASCQGMHPYSRRDYYKVTLIIGEGRLEYANRTINIDRPALLFSNPLIPYLWQPLSQEQEGWFCIFNKAFVHQRDELLTELPMFQLDGQHIYFPEESVVNEISELFRKMMAENQSTYPFKQDVLRSYLHLIVHQALKMQPVNDYEPPLNASSRITSLFLELLERQFPIDSMQNQLQLRSATDFARQLSVHTNHLNRAVREITGKTTTEHIASRIIVEANELLTHSDWSVAEIASSLGFEYASYFNNFYKKATGKTPREVRMGCV
ncbi:MULTISPECIES: AraC family transcriptional regulator [unclassified Siphonobacter]|uniref:helix-turn-helix domain-containing protein n=1 Tax=unclassified Siphonobacter TaxID=2635712 RepID=UPI000CB449A1|nr:MULTISPECIES: helix-turn-helix domain-containing protein [unclassified Siphonobacter]MDQ1088346.1 AraC family transcriptional activator of pobA [Siphonobacter sp. SORGH_AS_1065]MDR6194489.1 AraC family transcriptional activator of pobA [Siphonobacter sp. SORGH_AS_0500]PKK37778.1 AraC family transcriptional regulator [Siphonobacter sp. SORGH_AS_0500]